MVPNTYMIHAHSSGVIYFGNPYRNEVYITLYATQTFYSNCLFDRRDLYKIVQKYSSCVFAGLKPIFSRVEAFQQPKNPPRSNTYPMKYSLLERVLQVCYHVTIIHSNFIIKSCTSNSRLLGLSHIKLTSLRSDRNQQKRSVYLSVWQEESIERMMSDNITEKIGFFSEFKSGILKVLLINRIIPIEIRII